MMIMGGFFKVRLFWAKFFAYCIKLTNKYTFFMTNTLGSLLISEFCPNRVEFISNKSKENVNFGTPAFIYEN